MELPQNILGEKIASVAQQLYPKIRKKKKEKTS